VIPLSDDTVEHQMTAGHLTLWVTKTRSTNGTSSRLDFPNVTGVTPGRHSHPNVPSSPS
jgi:hypothetical protein